MRRTYVRSLVKCSHVPRQAKSAVNLTLLIFSLCTLPFGCSSGPGDKSQRDVAPAFEHGALAVSEVPGIRLRGHVVLGHEVRTFQPCGEAPDLWVIPTPGLRSSYEALRHAPYQPMFAELRGELGPAPATGFGKEYAGQLKVLTVIRAAPATEGHGCAEDLTDIAFRAAGNEPFWHLSVTRRSIVFTTPGAPELEFPGASPLRSRQGWIYEAETKDLEARTIRFTVKEGRCTDTMVGAQYSWRAQVELDGQIYEGCAWEGDAAP